MNHRNDKHCALAMFVVLCACGEDVRRDAPPNPAAARAEADSAVVAPPAEAHATTGEAHPTTASRPPTEDPAKPAPEAMHVVLEGRCQFLTASVVGKDLFVAHGGGYQSPPPPFAKDSSTIRADIVAARLLADGSFERLPLLDEHDVAPVLGLHAIRGFSGRWPNQLFAELDVGYRDSSSRGVARLDGDRWRAVEPFGKQTFDSGTRLLRVHPWYDRSILAMGEEAGVTRLAVVRGQPKGPRMGGITKKTSCAAPRIDAYLVREAGDVVAAGGCDSGQDDQQWLTHWPVGEFEGTTVRIDHGSVVAFADAGDGTFYAMIDGSKPRLLRGSGSKWQELALPGAGAAGGLAVDPDRAVWLVRGDVVHHRAAEADAQWISESLPGDGPVQQLIGVEFGTPWVRREGPDPRDEWGERMGARLFRRGNAGWHEITVPDAAFFADKRIGIQRVIALGPDDMWAVGQYFVRRHGKKDPARYYRVVLHSQAPARPLRCGEVVDAPLAGVFVPWPTAVTPTCSTRAALLFHQPKWDDANDYGKLQKAVRTVEGVADARWLELEIGGEKFLAALVANDATAEALVAKAKKQPPYKYPEVVCGDEAVLDAAGVVVHRELSFH